MRAKRPGDFIRQVFKSLVDRYNIWEETAASTFRTADLEVDSSALEMESASFPERCYLPHYRTSQPCKLTSLYSL
jgi:hypothetical protein